MKRFGAALLLLNLCCLLSAFADGNVRAAQEKLREGGFYLGQSTGVYDSQTSAAVTRYQIRQGLEITGQLDAATARALGTQPVVTAAPGATPQSMRGTWRQLRNGEQQFVPEESSRASTPAPLKRAERRSAPRPAATARPAPRPAATSDAFDRDRLRDYVGAFILAGIDPEIGAELEFFANRVDYFGDGKVTRDKIRRDLLRYDRRWPERRFSLAGDVTVRIDSERRARVTFPLRYQLRSKSEKASGMVRKTLVLEKNAQNVLEIVGVSEKKMR